MVDILCRFNSGSSSCNWYVGFSLAGFLVAVETVIQVGLQVHIGILVVEVLVLRTMNLSVVVGCVGWLVHLVLVGLLELLLNTLRPAFINLFIQVLLRTIKLQSLLRSVCLTLAVLVLECFLHVSVSKILL
jgi:hypothetical protein